MQMVLREDNLYCSFCGNKGVRRVSGVKSANHVYFKCPVCFRQPIVWKTEYYDMGR